MNGGRARVPLILALAVLRRSEADDGATHARRRTGYVVSATPEDGALLVDTGHGFTLLVLVSDTVMRGGDGAAVGLEDLTAGDVVEWLADRDHGIVVVEEVTRLKSLATVA